MKIKGRLSKIIDVSERPFGTRVGEEEILHTQEIFVNPADLPEMCWDYNAALIESAKLDGVADGVNDIDFGRESLDVYFEEANVEVEKGSPKQDWICWDGAFYVKREAPDESKREGVFIP